MATPDTPELTENDIQFPCVRCANILVVDRSGAGLTVACPLCEQKVVVPPYTGDPRKKETLSGPVLSEPPAAPPPRRRDFDFTQLDGDTVRRRAEELGRLLKENQSQRVEIQGYINQANLQAHRNLLKLRKLMERQSDYEAEMDAVRRHLAG